MLSVYQNARFAEPENPVMRAVFGGEVMPTAGATIGPLAKSGLGCACGVKPFGLGLVNDEGVRLYGDWYGSQQNGGMRLNGDPLPGLGTYWGRKPAGMGDIETFVSNLTSGNFGAALSGNDFASSMPNILVLVGGWWLISTLTGQAKRTKRRVAGFAGRVRSRVAAKEAA